jgi:hypothetical protein
MVSNNTTSRETTADKRHAYISILENLGFQKEHGQLREWMAVARDEPAWAEIIESHFKLTIGSFTNLRRH